MQKLEKWYWRIYLQGSNGETDVQDRLKDTGRGKERLRCKERVMWKLTLAYVKYSQWEFAVWLRKLKQGLYINLEGWDGQGDEREVQKGGDRCIPMADSCWGLVENNKIL